MPKCSYIYLISKSYAQPQDSPAKKPRRDEKPPAWGFDVMLADRTGLVNIIMKEDAAIEAHRLMCMDTVVSSSRMLLSLHCVRVTDLPKNDWNGRFLMVTKQLSSISTRKEAMTGTSLSILPPSTVESPFMKSAVYQTPSGEYCFHTFPRRPNFWVAPFRVTLKGTITNVQGGTYSDEGNVKVFSTSLTTRARGFFVARLACLHTISASGMDLKVFCITDWAGAHFRARLRPYMS